MALTAFQAGRALDAVYVRKAVKDHGSRRMVEGDGHLPRESPVVVLEDVVTTGGSTIRALETLREAGLTPVGVVAILDRLEGGADAIRAAGVSFTALYTRRDVEGET